MSTIAIIAGAVVALVAFVKLFMMIRKLFVIFISVAVLTGLAWVMLGPGIKVPKSLNIPSVSLAGIGNSIEGKLHSIDGTIFSAPPVKAAVKAVPKALHSKRCLLISNGQIKIIKKACPKGP